MLRCSFCGEVITDSSNKGLWEHIKEKHNKIFNEIKDWESKDMITECYESVENETVELYQMVKEINLTVKKLKDERNKFLTIAYNAICLGQLDEVFEKDSLLKELGCTLKEYEEIME